MGLPAAERAGSVPGILPVDRPPDSQAKERHDESMTYVNTEAAGAPPPPDGRRIVGAAAFVSCPALSGAAAATDDGEVDIRSQQLL